MDNPMLHCTHYHEGWVYNLGTIAPQSDRRKIMRRPYLGGPLEQVGDNASAYHLWTGYGRDGESLYCLGDGCYGYQVWKYDPDHVEKWRSDQDCKDQQISPYVRQLILLLGITLR